MATSFEDFIRNSNDDALINYGSRSFEYEADETGYEEDFEEISYARAASDADTEPTVSAVAQLLLEDAENIDLEESFHHAVSFVNDDFRNIRDQDNIEVEKKQNIPKIVSFSESPNLIVDSVPTTLQPTTTNIGRSSQGHPSLQQVHPAISVHNVKATSSSSGARYYSKVVPLPPDRVVGLPSHERPSVSSSSSSQVSRAQLVSVLQRALEEAGDDISSHFIF